MTDVQLIRDVSVSAACSPLECFKWLQAAGSGRVTADCFSAACSDRKEHAEKKRRDEEKLRPSDGSSEKQ